MVRAKRPTIVSCVVTGVVAASVIVAGCGSDNGSAAPNTRATTTTTPGPRITDVEVNLSLTGDRTATVQGTKGKCTIPRFGAPTYDFAGKDYPSLGPEGSISIAGPVTVANGSGSVPANVKVTLTTADPANDVGFLSDVNGTGISLSRNDLVVMLDAPLTGGLGGAEDINLLDPENSLSARLTGSIRCVESKSD